SAIQPYEGSSTTRAEVMNRVRDQLLHGACLSLDKNRRIRRRHPYDLVEHRFQSRTFADDMLESTVISPLISTHESLHSAHRKPPGNPRARYQAQSSRAARTFSSRTSSSNALASSSTARALSACIRIFVSPCAVMKMVGILQCSALSLAWSSRPDIPGIRISAIRHAVCWCWPDLRNSSADANASDDNPTDLSMLCNALRINSSSSTIAISFAFVWVAMVTTYRSVDHGAIMLWYEVYNTCLNTLEAAASVVRARHCR